MNGRLTAEQQRQKRQADVFIERDPQGEWVFIRDQGKPAVRGQKRKSSLLMKNVIDLQPTVNGSLCQNQDSKFVRHVDNQDSQGNSVS